MYPLLCDGPSSWQDYSQLEILHYLNQRLWSIWIWTLANISLNMAQIQEAWAELILNFKQLG